MCYKFAIYYIDAINYYRLFANRIYKII